LKLFGVHPSSIWKRTANDVVSVTQMQSSGEQTIRRRSKMAQSRDDVSRLFDGRDVSVVIDAVYTTRRIREFDS
jgi:hypothetical protein